MAVDIDKWMEDLEPLAPVMKHNYNNQFTKWLADNGWRFISNNDLCDKFQFKDLYYIEVFNNGVSFLYNESLSLYAQIYKTIKLPPEATDEECIEIVKRLMEKFK